MNSYIYNCAALYTYERETERKKGKEGGRKETERGKKREEETDEERARETGHNIFCFVTFMSTCQLFWKVSYYKFDARYTDMCT